MGHYCRICHRQRANEQFSGKGHRIHVCKRCKAMPKSERKAIENMDDIFRFMQQSHISEKNVVRLEQMVKSENPQVARLAAIVLEVARVKPYKTRRLKFLAQKHPELFEELEDTGLVFAHSWDWEPAELRDQADWEEAEISDPANWQAGGISVGENPDIADLSVQDDLDIPF